MTPFDLVALAAALPTGTVITTDSLGGLSIGGSFTTANDTSNWTETVSVNKVSGTDAGGNLEYTLATIENWPAGVTSAEQALAFAYFTSALQAQMGDAYAAAVSTLPAWTPGADLPVIAQD